MRPPTQTVSTITTYPTIEDLTDAELAAELATYNRLSRDHNDGAAVMTYLDRRYLCDLEAEYLYRLHRRPPASRFKVFITLCILFIVLIAAAIYGEHRQAQADPLPGSARHSEVVEPEPSNPPNPVNDSILVDVLVAGDQTDWLFYAKTDNDTITEMQHDGLDVLAYCPQGYELIEDDNSCKPI